MVDVQNTLVINAIINYGTEDQKQRYLPKLATEWVDPTRSARRVQVPMPLR